ncbi:DUF262 domain-containing protein [Burkholderia sp. S-53]|uniref:DUF262 domain-containing protein n=1 Tax=Burkholderia sp. S-53 TaxID=2906514 RepID=UPI0021D269B6|nr:DUF262 domain-containing protein [Burkholderia sp. S-53]UXU86968.1 DUF262 domain-containing protein [Burkholderia sp. S-53]
MKTSATNRRVHQLLTAISDKKLNPRPDFQRRLVWTNDDKISFIKTVLRGLPFPEIYVCAGSLDPDTGQATEFLVDGQQRITTLYQYFKAIPGLRLGDLRQYAELTTAEKEAFLEYEVVVRDLGKQPLDEIHEIFELINSANYALNSIEIKNARYAGEFKKFAEEVSKWPEFKKWKIFNAGDVRRMQDVRYCLVLLATLLSTYFNRDEDIEEYLSKYNDIFPEKEDLRTELSACLAFVDGLGLPDKSRAFRKTDLFSLLVEVYRAKYKRHVQLDAGATAGRLETFFAQIDGVAATGTAENMLALVYYRSTVRAAIDRANRYRRGEILQSILDPSYKPNTRFSTSEGDWPRQEQLALDGIEEGDY